MNCAVTSRMKTKHATYTADDQSFSLRSDHSAFRCSALLTAAAVSGAPCRRLASKSTINAASASIVMKKKTSFRTIGPISAISCWLDGSTPASASSWYPESNNCAATKNRITVVTLKNRCRLTRTLPFTNITPNTTDSAIPISVPSRLDNSDVFSDSADRISTVSTPSRSTIKKMNRNIPQLEPAADNSPKRDSMFFFRNRAVFIMKATMLITNAAATNITQPSNRSVLISYFANTTASAILSANADPSAQKTTFFSSSRPVLLRYANTIPTISAASTPSRNMTTNELSMVS